MLSKLFEPTVDVIVLYVHYGKQSRNMHSVGAN